MGIVSRRSIRNAAATPPPGSRPGSSKGLSQQQQPSQQQPAPKSQPSSPRVSIDGPSTAAAKRASISSSHRKSRPPTGDAGNAPPTPGREKERERKNSHHRSPSAVASAILKTASRDYEGVVFGFGEGAEEMEDVERRDGGMKEALWKLDGLTSPRLSGMQQQQGQGQGQGQGRRGEDETIVIGREKRGLKKLVLGSASGSVLTNGGTGTTPPTPSSASGQSMKRTSGVVEGKEKQSPSINWSNDVMSPPPSSTGVGKMSTMSKRASSSSTSLNAMSGSTTSYSIGNSSRDSATGTGTSLSQASKQQPAVRARRSGSVGSDTSSVRSSGMQTASGETTGTGDESDIASLSNNNSIIPPVPPIPKDWNVRSPVSAVIPDFDDAPTMRRMKREQSNHSLKEGEGLLSPIVTTVGREKERDRDASSAQSGTPKSPGKKWTFSNALGISRSPSLIKESISSPDLARKRKQSGVTSPQAISAPQPLVATSSQSSVDKAQAKRKSSLVPEMHVEKMRKSESDMSVTSSFEGGKSVTTKSSSSHDTRNNRISNDSDATQTMLGASPSRTRSSVLSPRRTPSGIPFFSRKTSGTSGASSNDVASSTSSSSPRLDKPDKSPAADHPGRKSILGLNFLRTQSSRKSANGSPEKEREKEVKEKEKTKESLEVSNASSVSSSTRAPPSDKTAQPVGRKSSVSARASVLIGRKRGKVRPSPSRCCQIELYVRFLLRRCLARLKRRLKSNP
ncbi:hypothetical protein BT69DRAFT_79254 [Atractiella rhizophila]|nr:hypothetical protein BT69DRAFT_79254 [Atractiella rhizophila]